MSTIQPNIEQPVSDEMALVRRAKRGDDQAFEELVRRYDRNVFRIAQHITQNREDAEDVVQEAFLKAYGNLAKFQEQSKFYTWLVRIAVNEALMKLRRRKPERTVSLDEEVKTEDDSLPREVRSSSREARSAGRSRSGRPPTRSYSCRGSNPHARSAASNVDNTTRSVRPS